MAEVKAPAKPMSKGMKWFLILSFGFMALMISQDKKPLPPAQDMAPAADETPSATSAVPAAPTPRLPRFLEHTPKSVSLDWDNGQMTIVTTIRAPGDARPEYVWVWAFFMNDLEGDESRSDTPIQVPVEWNGTDTATVTAYGTFHWRTIAEAPRSGYRARVLVSPLSSEAAQQRVAERDKRSAGMVRVR